MLESDVAGSSLISKVRFENGVLYVKFKSGAEYKYFNVPEGVYWEIASAFSRGQSAGKYFTRTVKNSYKYQKIS